MKDDNKRDGAPPLSFEIAFVLGCTTVAVLLYGKPRLIDLIVAWLAG